MNDFYNRLTSTLQREQSYITDNGEIKKWLVINAAQNYEKRLIELLIDEEELRNKFFIEINGHWVFNERLFISFMENKNYFNDSYTRFKNKIGLTIDGKYISQKNEVSLVWPFKDCILEGGQSKEEQKREEIFFNELLAQDEINQLLEPKVLTNWKRYTTDGEQKVTELKRDDNGFIKENLIIKGNNLLALHSIKPQFEGRVKLIYIDPPYNTGSDGFKYNDKFNHSSWLTFMKNRLEAAKLLLRNDGFIFVQCDDNEQAYLKILMDDIFGEENIRAIIYVQTVYANKTLKQDRVFHDQIEQILLYSKTPNSKIKQEFEDYNYDKFCWQIKEKSKPIKTLEIGKKKVEVFNLDDCEISEVEPSEKGLKEIWASGTILDMNSSGRFFRDHLMNRIQDDGYNILYKVYGIGDDNNDFRYFTGPKKQGATKGKYYQGVPKNKIDIDLTDVKKTSIENFWSMAADFGNCRSEGGVEFKSGKKPEKLLSRIIDMSTEPGDIVLDYHLGSGTTSAVAHKMGRQFIGIEQLCYGDNDSIIRLQNVIGKKTKKRDEMFDSIEFDKTGITDNIIVNWKGGGNFIYIELNKYNESFIEKIEKAKDTKTIIKIWEEMKEHSFLNYNIDIKQQDEAIGDFKNLTIKEQKQHLCEILNKNQLYINLSSIDDSDFKISKEDKELNSDFYGLKK